MENTKRIELTDDGTMDTVLRCSICAEEFRFNQDCLEDIDRDDNLRFISEEQACEAIRDEWIEDCIAEIENEHVCEGKDS